ncbi:MAG: hypothetical protein V4650_11715 [Pseudomonadota bacterium]
MIDVDRGDGWVVREIPHQELFERTTFYFYKGQSAHRIALESKASKQLAGYALIEKDLRNISSWIKEIDRIYPISERPTGNTKSPDRERFNLIKGLYIACVTSYAKCFTQCDGRNAQLKKNQIDLKFREAHEDVMSQRNNYTAHSGAKKYEYARIALVLPARKAQHKKVKIFTELSQPDMWLWHEEEISFPTLIAHAHAITQEKIEKTINHIIEKEINPKSKDYWYRRAKKG